MHTRVPLLSTRYLHLLQFSFTNGTGYNFAFDRSLHLEHFLYATKTVHSIITTIQTKPH